MGPAGGMALFKLAETLTDPDAQVRRSTVEALGKIGPSAVPALIAALKVPGLRGLAAAGLGEIGPRAPQAIVPLVAAMRDTEEETRRTAARALEKIGPAAILALVGVLRRKDPSDQVSRVFAARALGAVEPRADAIAALVQALGDKDESIRLEAAAALGRPGPEMETAVPALVKALNDEHPAVRGNAAGSLGQIAPDAEAVVPSLIHALGDREGFVREEAARALGALGPAAKDAVPRLIAALKDQSPLVRQEAAYSLREIGPAAEAAVPALIEALKDADVNVRRSACGALGQIGKKAESAVPALSKLMRESGMTGFADCAIRRISSDNRDTVGWPSMSLRSKVPELPWPPPAPTNHVVLRPRDMLGSDTDDLKAVYDRLVNMLDSNGYSRHVVYGVPGGFALVTQVERIEENGKPIPEPHRWTGDKIPLNSFSLAAYLDRLFRGEHGHFRLIVFVLTPRDFGDSGPPLSEVEARLWVGRGWQELPLEVGLLKFKGQQCHVLVYRFRKGGETSEMVDPDPLSVHTHLRMSGLWTLPEEEKR
jgi:HEAT repeat protein